MTREETRKLFSLVMPYVVAYASLPEQLHHHVDAVAAYNLLRIVHQGDPNKPNKLGAVKELLERCWGKVQPGENILDSDDLDLTLLSSDELDTLIQLLDKAKKGANHES